MFDPIRNALFVRHCKDAKLLGDARTWNEFLLQLSRDERLHDEGKHKEVSLKTILPACGAAEIAFQMLSVDYAMDLEQILCTPDAAGEFDSIATLFGKDQSVIEFRTAIWHFRRIATNDKTIRAAKKLAVDFASENMPPTQSIDSYLGDAGEESVAGVFAISDPDSILYIGQATDIAEQLGQIRTNDGWNRFEPTDVQIWPIQDMTQALVYRCLLVTRHKPWLNAHFLHQPIAMTLF